MKKSYIFIVLLIVFLLTGCSIKSEVTVNYDGKVFEDVEVLTNTVAFKNENYSVKQMIENVISNYLPALEFRKYKNETIVGDKKSGGKFTKQYDSICSYFQDTGFNQYVYKHIKCQEDKYYITINNDTKYIPYCEDCSDWPRLDDIVFELTLPIKVDEHNADSVDKNTYIWKYDSNTKDKDFYLRINKTKLKENEVKYERKNKVLNAVKLILKIIVIIAILIGLGFGSNKLYKKYKSNKLEY